MIVSPRIPYLLRTAHNVRALCRSLGYFQPQSSEQPDRVIEGPLVSAPLDGAAQLSDQHVAVGQSLAASICLAMQDARRVA